MNPFEKEESTTDDKLSSVEIWVESNGKRKNTFISGLKFDGETLKEHLKNLKKKHGCNGSIKDITVDGHTKEVLQLQGEHLDNVSVYLKSIGITDIITRDFNS